MEIKKIEKRYDKGIEAVIRECCIEYGLDRKGTAWSDPYLAKFSEYYSKTDKREYYVIIEDNKVVGGCGFGELHEDTCEITKMYIDKNYRSRGYGHKILKLVEEKAKISYNSIYLETSHNMVEAIKFYKKHGYEEIDYELGSTGPNERWIRMLKKV